jgi:glycosyltransferase involved in cell wall biosynthesis
VAEDLVKVFGYDKKRIVVAYPGVDTRFQKNGNVFKSSIPYFLFVGSLKAGKNIPGLLRGFAKFLQFAKQPYDLYLIGGEYWKDPEIYVTISTLKLEDRIKRLSAVSDVELPKYYRGAVSFVSPSFHEGFCLPAAEAMASGCPVIGSTDKAMQEVVGDAGIFVHPTDAAGLSQAMQTMAYNAKKRQVYAKNGLKHATQYTWESFASNILRTIKEM